MSKIIFTEKEYSEFRGNLRDAMMGGLFSCENFGESTGFSDVWWNMLNVGDTVLYPAWNTKTADVYIVTQHGVKEHKKYFISRLLKKGMLLSLPVDWFIDSIALDSKYEAYK